MALYPSWIEHLRSDLQRVNQVSDVDRNHYIIRHGGGYPGLFGDPLKDSIAEMNEYRGFQHLVVCFDSDEESCDEALAFAQARLEEKTEQPKNFEVKFIVQHRCIETWLLGNSTLATAAPTRAELVRYRNYFDVRKEDPEAMPCHPNFAGHAAFHLKYLKLLFREKNLSYSKRRPADADRPYFLDGIQKRAVATGHLSSYTDFHTFLTTA